MKAVERAGGRTGGGEKRGCQISGRGLDDQLAYLGRTGESHLGDPGMGGERGSRGLYMGETTNLIAEQPDIVNKLNDLHTQWKASVEKEAATLAH